jgi:adenylyltransferase/sulfurtransferase
MPPMDDAELLRYSRHLLLPEIDVAGQQRLRDARVLVLGLGGLGSAAAMYLAASGAGRLLLADPDRVELSNLSRQVLHGTSRVGWLKTDSALAALADLNPGVSAVGLSQRLDAATLGPVVGDCDVVLDCSDNYATRYALSDACFAARVPLVSAAALGWEGQLTVFDPRVGGPCYRCIYPDSSVAETRSCATEGVVSAVVGTMGVLQALEAIKLLTGSGVPLRGTLLVFDGLSAEFRRLRVPARAGCAGCGG